MKSRNPFYLFFSIWVFVIVLLGFGPSYYLQLGTEDHSAPWYIHFHAIVFTGWAVLFLVQAWKVFSKNVRSHRKWGKIGMYYGVFLILVGVTTGFLREQYYLAQGESDSALFIKLVSIRDMLVFSILFGLAMYYRMKPNLHKLWILAASNWILIAAVARIDTGGSLIIGLLVWFFPILVAFAIETFRTKSFAWRYLVVLIIYVVGSFLHEPFVTLLQ